MFRAKPTTAARRNVINRGYEVVRLANIKRHAFGNVVFVKYGSFMYFVRCAGAEGKHALDLVRRNPDIFRYFVVQTVFVLFYDVEF